MPPISVMFKPASSLCNMRCRYCFYHSVAENREMPSHGMMGTDTLETALRKAFAYADGGHVALSFQGGEPLLAGKEFFLTAERLIRTLNTARSPVSVGVQTNGTLLDEEWCRMFARFGWLVGLSLDGDRIANAYRVDAEGAETFDRVCAAARLLQKNRVEFNVLCVLTRPVGTHRKDIRLFQALQIPPSAIHPRAPSPAPRRAVGRRGGRMGADAGSLSRISEKGVLAVYEGYD